MKILTIMCLLIIISCFHRQTRENTFTVYLYYSVLDNTQNACEGLKQKGFHTTITSEQFFKGWSCIGQKNNIENADKEMNDINIKWKPDHVGWHMVYKERLGNF